MTKLRLRGIFITPPSAGVLLVKLWKRYLLVNVPEHQVFDIDPRTVKPQGDAVQWSTSDRPKEPLEITDWKDRNVGPVERLRFRLGKDGQLSSNCKSRYSLAANRPINVITGLRDVAVSR